MLPAGGPQVTLTGAAVAVTGAPPSRGADVWLVRYEPNPVQVPIRRGENGGKTLSVQHAVRELTRLGEWAGGAKTFALPAGRTNLKTAVLIQAGPGGPILAAAKS